MYIKGKRCHQLKYSEEEGKLSFKYLKGKSKYLEQNLRIYRQVKFVTVGM